MGNYILHGMVCKELKKNTKCKRWFVFLAMSVFVLFFCSYKIGIQGLNQQSRQKTFMERDLKQEISIENVDVKIPNLCRSYTFVYLSDLHIIKANSEVAEEHVETVNDRQDNMFITTSGVKAADIWESLATYINDIEADAVLLGGDMIDYASASNCKSLADGLGKIKQPILYTRADHDYAGWYTEASEEATEKLQKTVMETSEIYTIEYDDMCIVGIDNSTQQISKKALKKLKCILEKKKPIILITHVPVESMIDKTLGAKSQERWGNRKLLWGLDEETYYKPNKTTKKFLEMIYANNTPVKEVFSGHLHFTWDGPITEQVHQHVFSPAYECNIGIIKVHP